MKKFSVLLMILAIVCALFADKIDMAVKGNKKVKKVIVVFSVGVLLVCRHWKRRLNIRRRRIHSNHGKMALAKAYIWQVWNVLIMQKHLMDGQNG